MTTGQDSQRGEPAGGAGQGEFPCGWGPGRFGRRRRGMWMQPGGAVPYSRRRMPFWGLLCGMLMILGMPAILLTAGNMLNEWVQVVLIAVACVIGGAMAVTAIFFGSMFRRAQFSRLGGLACGMAVMLGLPAITLTLGTHLGQVSQVILIIMAFVAGGAMAVVSIFLGIVIPQLANETPDIRSGDAGGAGDGTARAGGMSGGGAGMGGFHVHADGDEVHVGPEGVYIRSKEGDRVEVGPGGVHIQDATGNPQAQRAAEAAKTPPEPAHQED